MKNFFGVFFHLAPGIAAITGFSFSKPLFTAHEKMFLSLPSIQAGGG